MNVTFSREGNILYAKPSGRIEGSNADEFRKAVEDAIVDSDEALVLDMESLTYISSVGLRMVAMLSDLTKRAGISFALCSPSRAVNFVFTSSGFDKLVSVVESSASARKVVASQTDSSS